METEIEDLLQQIRTILEKYGENGWAQKFAWLKEDWVAAQSPNSNVDRELALQRIKEIFGGMGSFSDLAIDHRSGHLIKPEEARTVNVELYRLSNQLFILVEKEISRFVRNDKSTNG